MNYLLSIKCIQQLGWVKILKSCSVIQLHWAGPTHCRMQCSFQLQLSVNQGSAGYPSWSDHSYSRPLRHGLRHPLRLQVISPCNMNPKPILKSFLNFVPVLWSVNWSRRLSWTGWRSWVLPAMILPMMPDEQQLNKDEIYLDEDDHSSIDV